MNLRALLELMRVSNLPTVWSNVVMGGWAGIYVFEQRAERSSALPYFLDGPMPPVYIVAAVLAVAMSLIYCGGMALNDAVDHRVDSKERPERPIPSGRVSLQLAYALATMMLVTGGALIAMTERSLHTPTSAVGPGWFFALLLLLCVVAYNVMHLQSTASVVLMGCCRGLIILTCASVTMRGEWFYSGFLGWLLIALPALVLLFYTLMISVVARREVDPARGGFGGPKTVMNMIAAMPLLDAAWLVVMGLWPASLVCVACAGLTKLGHRRIAGS